MYYNYQNEYQRAIEYESLQATFNVINGIFNSIQNKHQINYKQTCLIKQQAYRWFQEKLTYITNDFQPTLFGSASLEVSLPDSDLDIVLNPTKKIKDSQFLYQLCNKLCQYKQIRSCQVLGKATVPVLKFTYSSPQNKEVKFDISINTPNNKNTGFLSTYFMKTIFQVQPKLKQVFTIMKYIIRSANLHNGYSGGLSSYKLFIMIACYIEQKQINTSQCSLGEIIIHFMYFYAYQFDQNCTVLRFKKGQKCIISFSEYRKIPNSQKLYLTGVLKMVDPINDSLIRSSFSRYGEVVSKFKQFIDLFTKMYEQGKNITGIRRGLSIGENVLAIEKELSDSKQANKFQSLLSCQF